ncbi:hypothetical protein Rsub_07110 [Raphidocelis subcapitata]|uniref:Uncharacterized protein n=1 Tax=Raphidocelis subcapitata TaxID=307507 RepID=A0A2V0P8B2_9CHLO|nr:hypothetical protein Rsub_07110 [Raphidocelis subcapitata]|eukprot:GBF94123.1 hypothetical protein Rsub_07110 [Raphidocelis subcapitata]
MTEPAAGPTGSPYDQAISALTEPRDAAPAVLLLPTPAADLETHAGAPCEEARAVAAAAHARGVLVVGLARDDAQRSRAEALLIGCEARVLLSPPASDGGGGGAGAAALARLVKSATGAACEQVLALSSDAAALRDAARAGMTTVRLAAGPGRGLGPATLRRGLEAHAAKLQDSRGY